MIDIRGCDNLDLIAEIKDSMIDLIYCDILYGTGRKFKDYQDLKPTLTAKMVKKTYNATDLYTMLCEVIIMEEALNWWHNILTDEGRSNFPKPKDNDDILSYYTNPGENLNLDYTTYMGGF